MNMENLLLTESAIFYLRITRKWANFIAIVMFVMIGLMVLAGIFMGFALSAVSSMAVNSPMPLPAGFFTFFYLLMAAVYFFPALYLYRFAQHLGIALTVSSSEELAQSFLFLKRHYHFIGVLIIVGLIITGLAFLFAILAGIFGVMGTQAWQ
jgi:hypothetical protein